MSKPSRSSISPFRSRKSPAAPPPPVTARVTGARPTTPSPKPHSRPPVFPAASVAPSTSTFDRLDSGNAKENVTVTVRFRPLSAREIGKGDEITWFANGDYTLRNEYNPSIAYGFDRVFCPATTTRYVYDVAAQHAVNGAMEGTTVFQSSLRALICKLSPICNVQGHGFYTANYK